MTPGNISLRTASSIDSASLGTLRNSLHLQPDTSAFSKLKSALVNNTDSLSEPIPTVPKEITPEVLRPLLEAAEPEIVALAGYALALLGDARGLEPLLSYWRKRAANDPSWDKRVYQAIAQVGDDSKVYALEKIYAAARTPGGSSYRDSSIIKDLYWSIRAMEGPQRPTIAPAHPQRSRDAFPPWRTAGTNILLSRRGRSIHPGLTEGT